MFCECLQVNRTCAAFDKYIYHCKADKLKFSKISMFFYFVGYTSAQRPANSKLATCTKLNYPLSRKSAQLNRLHNINQAIIG